MAVIFQLYSSQLHGSIRRSRIHPKRNNTNKERRKKKKKNPTRKFKEKFGKKSGNSANFLIVESVNQSEQRPASSAARYWPAPPPLSREAPWKVTGSLGPNGGYLTGRLLRGPRSFIHDESWSFAGGRTLPRLVAGDVGAAARVARIARIARVAYAPSAALRTAAARFHRRSGQLHRRVGSAP